jgi:hypothetical protein
LFSWSGGNAGVVGEVAAAARKGILIDASHDAASPAYYRANDRQAPHNLYVHLPQLLELKAPANQSNPAPIFNFRKVATSPSTTTTSSTSTTTSKKSSSTTATIATPTTTTTLPGVPTPGFSLDFGGVRVDYVWNAATKGWSRLQVDQTHPRAKSPTLDTAGVQVSPENVIVQFIDYGQSPSDSRSPMALTVGSGTVLVFSDGRVVSGTWSRATADKPTTYTAAEKIKRGNVSEDEVKTMGGIDKADAAGFEFAIRSVMGAKEAAIAALTLGKAASAQFDPAKFFSVAQTALDAIRRYEGRTVLYGATATLRKAVQQILGDADFGPVLARTIAGTSPQVAATGFNFAAWMNALAMLAGVDAVLAGDSAIWAAGDLAGCLGIAKIDDGSDALSHKWKPVLGKVFQFLPDGTQPYTLTGIPDRITHNNLYDAQIWIEAKLLNTGANYVIDGVIG